MILSLLWMPVTLLASFAQVLRNSAQAGLTSKIGTLGATQVRFVFGLPFALVFLGIAMLWTGEPIPAIPPAAWSWAVAGALGQIAATALMLVVMRAKAFGVAYAYIKTEPVIVAVFGALFLGDTLSGAAWFAVGAVTLGVLLAAVRPSDWNKIFREAKPAATGVLAGALFGVSVVAFRGAIENVPTGGFVMRSLTMLVVTLSMQTVLLGLWLGLRDRAAFTGSLREWRGSLGAGGMGALASAAWFIAFSLTAAANVRTLALVEIPIAALISRRISGKPVYRHEAIGFVIIAAGVVMLVMSHPA